LKLLDKVVVFINHVACEGERTDAEITIIGKGECEERIVIKRDLMKFFTNLETLKEFDLLPKMIPSLLVTIVRLFPDRPLLDIQINENVRDLCLIGEIAVDASVKLDAKQTLPFDASMEELEATKLLFFSNKQVKDWETLCESVVAAEGMDHVRQ